MFETSVAWGFGYLGSCLCWDSCLGVTHLSCGSSDGWILGHGSRPKVPVCRWLVLSNFESLPLESLEGSESVSLSPCFLFRVVYLDPSLLSWVLRSTVGSDGWVSFIRGGNFCILCSATVQQEPIDPRRQVVMGNQIIDARGRKFTKRLVDIRELNEQAKVIDDLKYVKNIPRKIPRPSTPHPHP